MAAMAASTAMRVALKSYEGLRAKATEEVAFQTPGSSAASRSTTPNLNIVATKKVLKKKQIILLKDIDKLGSKGELLTVKPGYFRNFLFPKGQAKSATRDILAGIRAEEERIMLEKKKVKDEAEDIARQFQTIGAFIVRRKVGKDKQIFGSVTSQDLVDIIRAQTNREIEKKNVTLPEIKSIGRFTAEIKLHPEVTVSIGVTVSPS